MKFAKIISLLLVAILGVSALASCGTNDGSTESAMTYVTLRINPEIELLADEDGDVVAASAINEDGEIVLSAVELEGKSIEEAGKIFTETANELGYLTPNGENDTVYVDVEGSTDAEESNIREKINNSIRHYFNNNGINGKVSPETLDKYADRANEWGLSTGHVKLVMRVLDTNPELVDTDVIKLSVKELMSLLKGDKNEEKIAAGLKADYRAAVSALENEYARLFELRLEIEALEEMLEGNLTDDEKSAIKAQISEKEDEMNPLQNEYKSELNEIKDSFRDASKEMRKEYRKEAEKRKSENKKSMA